MKLINNHRQPITLSSGVILAAAGTPGSTKEVEAINEVDRRRHVEPGRITVAAEPEPVKKIIAPAKEESVSSNAKADTKPSKK